MLNKQKKPKKTVFNMRQKDQQLQQPPLTSPLTRGLFHTTRPILLPWQKSESSIAGKRGSSKRRPLCRHCLFSVEYCCPSKAFTDVNILQPWGWQHVRVERHRCSWYQHTHTHTRTVTGFSLQMQLLHYSTQLRLSDRWIRQTLIP